MVRVSIDYETLRETFEKHLQFMKFIYILVILVIWKLLNSISFFSEGGKPTDIRNLDHLELGGGGGQWTNTGKMEVCIIYCIIIQVLCLNCVFLVYSTPTGMSAGWCLFYAEIRHLNFF